MGRRWSRKQFGGTANLVKGGVKKGPKESRAMGGSFARVWTLARRFERGTILTHSSERGKTGDGARIASYGRKKARY